MADTIKEVAQLVLSHFKRCKILLDDKQILRLKEEGLATVDGYECHIANKRSEKSMRLVVNKSWFKDRDNSDKPSVNSNPYDVVLIPTREKLYALHYTALRKYALELEKDTKRWFFRVRWGILIDKNDNSFTWEGGNTKKFPLTIIGSTERFSSLEGKIPEIVAVDINEPSKPERVSQTILRIIRDTNISRYVKKLYAYKCQLCGESLNLNNGKFYAEAHHLKPLGSPHDGLDIKENVLCVCPNHHALLDFGAIDLEIEKLHIHDLHLLSRDYIDYHNSRIVEK
jgi:hypothetical protein